jgi:hypothetical protein
MSDAPSIAKARLLELTPSGQESPDHQVTVQFNPETLKVSFSNQVVPPENGASTDQRGTTATQYVGKGATKLSVQLWFDVTAVLPEGENAADVRELTKKVAYFITPRPSPQDANKQVPPATRFVWGTFQFDGLLESMEESLEFFSPDGRPLRASVSLTMSQQRIEFAFARDSGAGSARPGTPQTPGTRPLTQATSGSTLQQLAETAGAGGDWQGIAAANGIENPRQLAAGQLIDLQDTARSAIARV